MKNGLNLINGYEWSTHQPLIRTVMELHLPKFVLELGIGINSTPVFLEYKPELLCVENNEEWINHIKKLYGNINIIHHKLINVPFFLKMLTEAQKKEINSYYLSLNIPDLKPNLLFVDQYASCRTLSINCLGEKFDFIIYHDADPAGRKANEYNLVNLKEYSVYYLTSPLTWTALMIKKDIDKGYEELKATIRPHIEKYRSIHHEVNKMELIKIA